MAIQRLKGYKAPGEENMGDNALANFTDENVDKGPSPWDEIGRAETEMLKIPVKGDRE